MSDTILGLDSMRPDMTDEQIVEMLKDIIEMVDYDHYKEIFVHEVVHKDYVSDLVKIVRKHLVYE